MFQELFRCLVETFQFRHGGACEFQDSAVIDAAVLDIKSQVLVAKLMARIVNVAAFGQKVGTPSDAGMLQNSLMASKCCLRLFLTSTTSPAKVGLKTL